MGKCVCMHALTTSLGTFHWTLACCGRAPQPAPPIGKIHFPVYAIEWYYYAMKEINAMYKIEKNVPIPPSSKMGRFPYDELDVGDSFIASNVKLASVCSSNYRVGKRLGRKFIARQENGDVRVWRVS